jgi:hypothetical protein
MTQPARPAARRCAREQHCGDAAPGPDGRMAAAWAHPGYPFCRRCISAIARTLDAMPQRYVWLRIHLGDKTASRAERVTMSKEAPMPLRLDIDALIREMVTVLCSWEERVAAAENLSGPDTDESRSRRDEVAIPAAVRVLAPRLPVLLALGPEPMARAVTITRRTPPPAEGTVRVLKPGGWAIDNTDLSGADAGREIFRLAWMSRRLLGETMPPAVPLDGIPCKACDLVQALEVCADPRYRSECSECGDLLTSAEYLDWVRRYSAWARGKVTAGDLVPAHMDDYRALVA